MGADAIVYKYINAKTLVSLVVPLCMVQIYKDDDWRVLVRQDELIPEERPVSDWFITYLSEIAKWRKAE